MKKSIIHVLLVLFAKNLAAQDNNYWNQMPGSTSALMGGVDIAGVRDNSAVFYNPGALGFIDTSSLSLSASYYQYEVATIKNGGGTNVNIPSSKFQSFPLVALSGVIAPNKNSKHEFGYMLFTKNQTATNFSKRTDTPMDTSMQAGDGYISRNKNVEYIGDYNLQTSLNELWFGLSYAYK